MSTKQESCRERIGKKLDSTIETIRALWDLYCEDPEAYHDDYGRWDEYGLCFDYVEGGTEYNEGNGYFRFQLSTGGPGDEFRFYVNLDYSINLIEYWFLDWYDGARLALIETDRELMVGIWNSYFRDSAEFTYEKQKEC